MTAYGSSNNRRITGSAECAGNMTRHGRTVQTDHLRYGHSSKTRIPEFKLGVARLSGEGLRNVQTSEQRRLVRIASAMNTKARKLGTYGVVSSVELAMKPSECAYCGVTLEPGQGTFDHRLAFARGGHNVSANVVRCCITCNREKFDKTPSEFKEHQVLVSICTVCGNQFQPRWAEWQAGRARTCSRSCAAKSRWA